MLLRLRYRIWQKAVDVMNKKKYTAAFLLGFAVTCGYFILSSNLNFNNDYLPDTEDQGVDAVRLRHLLGGNGLAPGRSKNDGRWYSTQRPFELYAYSAFLDDRRSLGSLPVIRIIVVSQYLDGKKPYCLYYYKGQAKGHIIEATHKDIGAGLQRHGKGFREYIVNCPLEGEDVPSNVTIIPSLAFKPQWLMPVEVPDKTLAKDDFVACVSVTYWKQNPFQIVEWMELLNELGVSQVVIYNNSLTNEAARVFKHYDKLGFVDFRQSWNFIPDSGEVTIHMHMSPVINDCVYRHMYTANHIVVTDLDEIIIPKHVYNYQQMLKEIDEKQERGTHAARQYMFRNAYFFLDIPHVDESMPRHLRTLRHRWRLPASIYGYATKSIISPLGCINMHNHFCWGTTPLYNTHGQTVDVLPKYALNQHYKKCHLDQWEKPGACKEQIETHTVSDDALLRYKKRLIKRVNAQLMALNLDPSTY